MSDLSGAGRFLLITGLVLTAVGMLLILAPRFPGLDRLGRLPGDLVFERGPVTVFIPIVSSLVISILLTVLLNLISRR
jgi:Protein of unknown function (DUF2905)